MSNALNKHESKYFNTARLMDEALLILLEKKEYSFITVKEICTKAGVNRSTFYLHYETMDDLLRETLDYISQKFTDSFGELKPMDDMLLVNQKYILPYLEFLKEHKRVYMAAMSQARVFETEKYVQRAYSQIIYPVLDKLHVPKEEQKYVAAFYVSGLHSLVFTWVKGGCQEEINYICDLMMHFVPRE